MPATVAMNAVTADERRQRDTHFWLMVRGAASYQVGPQLELPAAGAALAVHAPPVAFA